MGDEVVEKLYKHLERTYFQGAIELDTNNLSIDECVSKIKREVETE